MRSGINESKNIKTTLERLGVYLLLLLTPAITSPSAASRECQYLETNTWTSPKRVLAFPPNVSLGNLLLFNGKEVGDGSGPHTRMNAKGKIIVPANKFVTLQASDAFFRNPKLIETLQPDALDCLELKLMSMDDSEDNLCDRAVAHITILTGLRVLILDKSEVSDNGLKLLKGLTNLEFISGFLTPLQGDFLKDLRTLKKLRTLDLASVGLVEEHLQYLPDYQSLQNLYLNRANVSDKGIRLISGCSKIKRLRLSDNPSVTDVSVAYLSKMHTLELLQLDGTNISFEGLEPMPFT